MPLSESRQLRWWMLTRPHLVLPLVLSVCSVATFAFDSYWPVEFAGPETMADPGLAMEDSVGVTEDPAQIAQDSSQTADSVPTTNTADSSAIALSSKTTYYHTFRTQNRLDYLRQITRGTLEQSAVYQYTQLSSRSSVQFADLSGNIMYRNFRIDGLDAGFIWTPVVSYSKQNVGALQGNANIGPVVSHRLAGVPYTVQAGLYGYTWNDSITPWLLSASDGEYTTKPGLFGSFSLGDGAMKTGSLPLAFSVNGWGRTAGGNNLGLLRGGALYKTELPVFGGGDTLFVHAGDSITNGKELYIGESVGSSFVSNTSWRTSHSFSGTAGVALKERFALLPRIYYRYGLHSIMYPSDNESLNDIRYTGRSTGLTLRLRENERIDYIGGIEFTWKYEDWLFKKEFSDSTIPDDDNRNAYIINQSDHYSDIARTDHHVKITLPARLHVRYHLAASKDSKRYPFVYREKQRDTSFKRNENENDRIQTDHLLSLHYDLDSSVNVQLYGKYGIMYHYYYHENRCAESRTTKEYRAGINAGLSIGPFKLREHLFMDAEVSDYYFKKIGDKPIGAPPYNRDFSSTLSGKWNINDMLSLNGNWVHLFSDDGYWYGTAYWPDSSGIDHEYYAIDRKGTQYWIYFWFEYLFPYGKCSVGSKFRDVFERRYDFATKTYKISNLDIGYGIEPYMLAELHSNRYMLTMRIRRIFNTGDENRWSKRKNWDLAMVLQMAL
jgi:hypothetical protein